MSLIIHSPSCSVTDDNDATSTALVRLRNEIAPLLHKQKLGTYRQTICAEKKEPG